MKQKGFTLVELMVVIAILAITLVLGLPSFSNLIDSNRVTANTNTLVGALNLARMEAVNRGREIRVSGTGGTSSWASGYRIWVDTDGDGAYKAGEEIRIYEGVKDSSTLSLNGGGTTIIYRASGFASASSSFKLCSPNTNIQGRAVTISAAGRVSVGEETCP